MRQYSFETWDVFTATRFTGNPLAVVYDADDLTTEEMQTITREFNLAETVFIFTSKDDANAAKLRIFTPGYEMPFAGHPTVGAAIALQHARELPAEFRLELNTGVFAISTDTKNGEPFAAFTNPNLPREMGDAPEASALETALGLPDGAIFQDHRRPRLAGAGVNYVYVCAPLENVRQARLNHMAFEALGLENTVGILLYAEGGDAPDATHHARMFAPDAGVAEDPATGSAAAGLPAHVLASTTITDGEHNWIVEQGVEMGRPSRIAVSVQVIDNAAARVTIGGNAVKVSEGRITI